MTDLAYKFTDQDVRRDPTLHDIAIEFLKLYRGDFDFLRGAQQDLAEGHPLAPGVIRGILNCMRADPDGSRLLPKSPTGRFAAVDYSYLQRRRQPKLRKVQLYRPAWIDVEATFKVSYYMSTAKTAYVAHLLDRERSIVRWYPHSGKLEVKARPVCSSNVKGVMCAHNDNRKICRQCQLILASRLGVFSDTS
jgi:hypothetical protein